MSVGNLAIFLPFWRETTHKYKETEKKHPPQISSFNILRIPASKHEFVLQTLSRLIIYRMAQTALSLEN